jgi:hypothetical protein
MRMTQKYEIGELVYLGGNEDDLQAICKILDISGGRYHTYCVEIVEDISRGHWIVGMIYNYSLSVLFPYIDDSGTLEDWI